MVLVIHLISWVSLLGCVCCGLTRQSIKAANRYLILSRLSYLALIITGVYLGAKTLPLAPVLTIIKAIAAIGTIGLIEVAFARWQESRLTAKLISLLIGGIALTVICGIGLHVVMTGQWF